MKDELIEWADIHGESELIGMTMDDINAEEPELENHPKSIEELLDEASQYQYNRAIEKIKEKAKALNINYLLECIYDQLKLDEYKEFEKELRIILGDIRIVNSQ